MNPSLAWFLIGVIVCIVPAVWFGLRVGTLRGLDMAYKSINHVEPDCPRCKVAVVKINFLLGMYK